MTVGFEIWLFAVALGASALGGMLGMASGVFIVPILSMFGHVGIRTAIAASIVSVIACSCGSAAPFLKARLTNIRLALVLETATTFGALTGVILTGLLSTPLLFFVFAVILALSAYQMLARRETSVAALITPPSNRWAAWRLNASYPNRDLGRDVEYHVDRLPLGMALMYGAGLVSALLGIGSGVLKIPAMDTALRLPIKVSSATSNFMIGVTGAASAGAYFVRGDIKPGVAGPIVLGSVLGAILGARILMAVRSDRLRWLFAGVLILLAGQMALAAFGVQLPFGGAWSMEPAKGQLEPRLGATLRIGTWVASAVIAGGMAWPAFHVAGGKTIVMAGIAIIIALPVVRVALMLFAFAKARDFRFVAVAAVVLLMIALGVLAGLHSTTQP